MRVRRTPLALTIETRPEFGVTSNSDTNNEPCGPRMILAGFSRPAYQFQFGDSRVHAGAGNVSRIAMLITVFPDAATAKACAQAGLYVDLHPDPAFGKSAGLPRRQIDSTTVVIDEHRAGRAGDSFKDDTGEYDLFLANGRVFAQGLASNVPHSKIVREDLERLAAEIAG